MFGNILDLVASIHTVILCRLHRIFCGLPFCVDDQSVHINLHRPNLLLIADFWICKHAAKLVGYHCACHILLAKWIDFALSGISCEPYGITNVCNQTAYWIPVYRRGYQVLVIR